MRISVCVGENQIRCCAQFLGAEATKRRAASRGNAAGSSRPASERQVLGSHGGVGTTTRGSWQAGGGAFLAPFSHCLHDTRLQAGSPAAPAPPGAAPLAVSPPPPRYVHAPPPHGLAAAPAALTCACRGRCARRAGRPPGRWGS